MYFKNYLNIHKYMDWYVIGEVSVVLSKIRLEWPGVEPERTSNNPHESLSKNLLFNDRKSLNKNLS